MQVSLFLPTRSSMGGNINEHSQLRRRHPGSDQDASKRRNIYTIVTAVILVAGGLCGAIPTVGPIISGVAMIIWGIFAGYGMLAINHLRYIKSGGREQGGGLWGGRCCSSSA